MEDKVVDVTIGGLLHDIGKIAYRSGDRRRHSLSGRDLIRELGNFNENVAECVAYHHAAELAGARIANDSLAYITYIADNISSGADRRESSEEEGGSSGFDPGTPLGSVFNILNSNLILNGDEKYLSYEADTLEHKRGVNYPSAGVRHYDSSYYGEIMRGLRDGLKGVECSERYLNSVSQLMESYASYVPSSTSKRELPDVSLFDHSKTTAAIACCIYEYLSERGVSDYRAALFDGAKKFYEEKSFLLFSCDMSGIQDFLYTVSGEKMLKSLRARSCYLELMMENIADEILERAGLSRANLLYSGGGHAYIIMANTKRAKALLRDAEKEINAWFMDNFKTSLYLAVAYRECCGNDFMNCPKGSYKNIYSDLSADLSGKKLARYDAETIFGLNFGDEQHGGQRQRECRECRRTDGLTDDGVCGVCAALRDISVDMARKDFFVINNKPGPKALILPFGKYLYLMDRLELDRELRGGEVSRFYSKNDAHTGLDMATNLWMGDYTVEKDFEDLAEGARGIDRIAVLRADVDNLGRAFASGFSHNSSEEYKDRFPTLSRSATLSRQLSMFFKFHINSILRESGLSMSDEKKGRGRDAVIVYSGGDDMFIVGGWNDCVELAIDVNYAFQRYSQGALTLSAGIGMYRHSYPMARMAPETGGLENAAKNADSEKNRAALFDKGRVYSWDELKDDVIGEKLSAMREFFQTSDERGKAMIYKLLEYVNHADSDRINLARLAYTLARLEPDDDSKKPSYSEFSRKFYGWALDERDRKKLATALELYVYLERRRETER